jgi:putative transposase
MQEPRTALWLRIRQIAQTWVRYGYRKIRVLLNREGWKVVKKLAYCLYREEGVTLGTSRDGSVGLRCIGASVSGRAAPSQVWGLDFVANR